jgi:gluconate 2-dehydrogenase gamma chain
MTLLQIILTINQINSNLMAISKRFTRRRFVQLAGAGAGSLCLLPRCSGQVSIWRFFTDEEALLIDAVAEQIIPADEWPGGRDSGVTNYIDKQLVGPLKRYQPIYRKGISALQETSKTLYFKAFNELSWEEQTFFLEDMEAGRMKEPVWANGFDQEFFGLIRDHSMQAYYGSPIHGGNKDKMSYRMMKLDYPLIIGQNRYKG